VTKTTFTEITVRALTPPEKGQKMYWDKSLAGFGLRVSQGGARTWILLDPRAKVRTQQTIGRYPIIGLKDARTVAKRLLAERTLGRHLPSTKRWDEAVKEYLDQLMKRRRASTHAHYTRFLRKYFPFAASKLSALTTNDFEQRLERLSDRKAEYGYAFSVLRAFLRWCQRRRYIEHNPIDPLRSPYVYKPRKRVLTNEELKAVWNSAGALGTYGQLIRVLILTGQRRCEAANLRAKVDKGDRLSLPDWLTKNGKEHTFPIGPMTRAILDGQPDALYFPAAGTTGTLMSGWSKMKLRLDRSSGVSGWTIHDLRRTLRTNWAALGISKDIAKRYINHVGGRSTSDMDEVYDQYTYFPEMKAAVETWEKYLATVLMGRPSDC